MGQTQHMYCKAVRTAFGTWLWAAGDDQSFPEQFISGYYTPWVAEVVDILCLVL